MTDRILTDEEYTRRVLARCSTEFHGNKVDGDDFKEALKEFIEAGQRLDRIKKALFYGRDFSWDGEGLVQEVDRPIAEAVRNGAVLVHAILGIATESVELCEAALVSFDSPNGYDIVNLQEEFGDANWYRTLALSVLGQTHEENIIQNDNKLEKRFGPVFSEQAANERDLDAERAVLEGKSDERS